MFQIEFGKFISSLRKEKDLTQDELAEKLNISSGKTISKWENGNSIPDFETIIQLSKEFDVSLYELSVCERVKNKSICKEDILKIIDKKQLKRISLKKKLIFILTIIIAIISLVSFIYTITNFNTTKVYTLESQNKEFKIQGTYTKTKDYSIFALTQIEYIGNNKQFQNIQINNYNYQLFNNKRIIYNHNYVKNIDNNSEITLKESLIKTNVLVDSASDYMKPYNYLNNLVLVISYVNRNEKNKKYEIEIPIKLIEQSNTDKIW